MPLKKFTLLLSLFLFTFLTVNSQSLVSYTYLGERTQAQLTAKFALPFFKNGVKYYKVLYKTPDIKGQSHTASGLVVVPDVQNKIYPMLCYQHGTISADTDAPSRLSPEADLPILFAGLGYVAVAPDYIGFGDSPGFHPYVHAETEASAGVDLMRATRELVKVLGIRLNDQNFITGYSQGGHAAMALHRKLELELKDEFKVTASAPMSGPYSIGEIMRDLVLSQKVYFYPSYIPNTIVSYQLAYGNIYQKLTDVFKSPYAGLIEKFEKDELMLSQLNTQLIAALIQKEGASIPVKMFQDSMILRVRNDSLHPFNVALRLNNVYNWAPKAPTKIYYCTNDDQVPFRNSIVADSVMRALGALNVEAIDVNPAANHNQCVTPAIFNAILFFAIYQQILDIPTNTSTEELSQLHVFPNPAKESVFIRNFPEKATMTVRDISGKKRLVFALHAGDNEIPVSSLNDGLYLLEVIGERRVWVEKLVIRG